jgi:hypothetical protein
VFSLSAANDLVGFDGFVPRAAFREQKTQQFLKGFTIGRIPEERPFPANLDEIFVFQLL